MELIEREQQLKKLADAWGQVQAEKGRIALVSGEAGNRKTSLVERFVSEQRRSACVLWGACDALFSPQPLGPFIEIAVQIQSDLLRFIFRELPHRRFRRGDSSSRAGDPDL